MELLQGLLNLIYPPRCLVCKKLLEENDGLCQECFQKIEIVKYPFCDICGKPLEPPGSFAGVENPLCFECRGRKLFFKYARSIGKYDGVLKECIHLLKYKSKKVILKPLNKLIETYLGGLIPLEGISFIIPVPLHKKRISERGFNQTELIANSIGSFFKIPVLSDVIEKTVHTLPQVKLTKAERAKNIKGVFRVKDNPYVKKGRILLVDDVYTTGATVNECASVLRKSGADEVYVLTVAHGI